MAYGRRYFKPKSKRTRSSSKKPAKSLSNIERLEQKIGRTQSLIEKLKSEIHDLGDQKQLIQEVKNLDLFLNKNKDLYDAKVEKYNEIRDIKNSRGIIKRTLFTDENELKAEQENLQKLSDSMRAYTDRQNRKFTANRTLKSISELKEKYQQACSDLSEYKSLLNQAIQKKRDRERKKEEQKIADAQREKIRAKKQEQNRAKVAAYENKTREEAARIKRLLNDQFNKSNLCPYCQNEFQIGEVHADHIYPVSKGGLSTKQNMVYVCSKCNSKKSDKTLLSFCKDEGLSFKDICERLEALNKDI